MCEKYYSLVWYILIFGISQFKLGLFGHMTCFDQSHTSKNIWWIIICTNNHHIVTQHNQTRNVQRVTPVFKFKSSPLQINCLKYVQVFLLGHALFIKTHRFPRALPLENCSLLKKDVMVHIFYLNVLMRTGAWKKTQSEKFHSTPQESFAWKVHLNIVHS